MTIKKLPNFPFIFGQGTSKYAAVSVNDCNQLNLVVLYSECAPTGTVHENNITVRQLIESVNEGRSALVAMEPSDSVESLKINVDASGLEKTLAVAKELEATLLRLKGLLP